MRNAYMLRPPRGVLVGKRNMQWLRQVEMPTDELTFSLQILVDDLENLQQQIRSMDKRIATLVEDEAVERLQRHLPEVATQTAATILYELGDVSRFKRAREVSAYAGLVPRLNMSGEGPTMKTRIWCMGRTIASDMFEWTERREKPGNCYLSQLSKVEGLLHGIKPGRIRPLLPGERPP